MAIIIKKEGNLEYLTAEGIGSPHAFTTRLGGVSEGIFASLNYGISRGDDPKNVAENYRILADAVGFDLKKLVLIPFIFPRIAAGMRLFLDKNKNTKEVADK